MSSTGSIIEFDRFRKIKDALTFARTDVAASDAPRLAWYLPGLLGKSRVSTTFGELPVEALRVRDDLRTFTGASAKVAVVDRIHLDQDFLRKQPNALPLRIPANAFGPGRPSQDMFVSPGQEICPDAHVATAFVKANDLRGRFNPDLAQAGGLTYFRFHCETPAIVRVDGVWLRVRP